MNDAPLSVRPHVAFFGLRNAGKSSLINAVTGQKISIVSNVKGTTTDPVYKSMELLPAGPVVFIDTPGLDDEGELGSERVKQAISVLNKTDVAVLVIDSQTGISVYDKKTLSLINEKKLQYIVVLNKCDDDTIQSDVSELSEIVSSDLILCVSTLTGKNIKELKEKIASLIVRINAKEKPVASDLVSKGSFVVLVVPIDKAAPKGRLILPQQQTIRDLLDAGCIPVVVRDSELESALNRLEGKVSLVITDSQAFKKVSAIVPENIPLTSFSILFSRYKGELDLQLNNVNFVDLLLDSDKVLIAEGCTHHRQCGDIGTEKIPRMLKDYTNKNIIFEFVSGTEFPEDLTKYKLIIHCGACMLNEKEMKSRIARAQEQNIPVTNYGMVLAKLTGTLERSISPLKK
jgi:[FeFe] hydrogenase H-cluster maturation GTPase HydF